MKNVMLEIAHELEEKVVGLELANTKEYKKCSEQIEVASEEMERAIHEVPDEKLRKKLLKLFRNYESAESNFSAYTTQYAFNQALSLGYGFGSSHELYKQISNEKEC